MSLMPAFEIGVWNVWIFVLAYLTFNAVPLNWVILRRDFKALFKKTSFDPKYGKYGKVIYFLSVFTRLLILVYSVFLPIPLGTAWFFSGLTIFILGLLLAEAAIIRWGTTPVDKPITSGLYRYSRHPMYIGIFIQFLGVAIVSTSLLFLLLVLIAIGFTMLIAVSEERFCLDKYGEAYREYMNRTPRWLGKPKSGK
jgi:protein-S-isoprenylcysteine O-methyltransferase Ste14